MLYKTECRFSCDEGFEAKGSMVRRCAENGTWIGTDLACTGIPHLSLTSPSLPLLEICEMRSDLAVPVNLKLLFASTFRFVFE